MSLKDQYLPWNNHVPVILGCGLGFVGTYYLIKRIKIRQRRNHLTRLRTKRQQERLEQFDRLERKYTLGAESAAIVALSFEELSEQLQKRKLTAKQVLEAYIANALKVTRETNCITQFVPQCFEWAEQLDSLPAPKGPLHGIPICVKEDHDIETMDSTLGYSMYLYQPKTESAVMVKILQDAGAVPFCKTNFPQTLFSTGSDNPIYGTTLNPLNKNLSPGGSSSGTGCLVGAGGALFGLGGDVGGSLRVPAHFCGISALSSTTGRLSGKGKFATVQDRAGITGVSGIMASRAKTLANVYEIAVQDGVQNQYDPLAVPIPWRTEMFESRKPLRIGYFTSMDTFPTIGDTPKTILEAKEALESLGHTVLPFEIPNPWEIYRIAMGLFVGDGWCQIYNQLKYDEVSLAGKKAIIGYTLSSSKLAQLAFKALECLKLIPPQVVVIQEVQKTQVLWEYLKKQRLAKYEVLNKMKEQDLDLILMPVVPFPALGVNVLEKLVGHACYTFFWNVLDFPAGVVPFGKESGVNIDSYNDEGNSILKLAKKEVKQSIGMPIGVQVVGKPFQEEMILRVLAELEEYQADK